MKLSRLTELRKCSDRSQVARLNEQSGGPEDWFFFDNLKKIGYKSFSFDFFVDWKRSYFQHALWFKYSINDISVQSLLSDNQWLDTVQESIIKCHTDEYLLDLKNFCIKKKLTADFLLFNDDQWGNSENDKDHKSIVYARLDLESKHIGFKVKVITLDELKNIITLATGRPFSIGEKGLIYSTSQLECILSTTDTPYPGDADLVLTNEDYSKFKIIEFKKHNKSDCISAQMLSNYYPKTDKAKYHRLEMLRKYLGNAELYTLYFTTDDRYQTKLELIKNCNENGPNSNISLVGDRSLIVCSPKDKDNYYEIMQYLYKCNDFFNS